MKNTFLTATLLTTSLLMAVPALAQGGGTDDPKTHVTTTKKPHSTKTSLPKKQTTSKPVSPAVSK